MAWQSVSKHLAVLEAAGLVTTVRRGREKLHYLNAAPISEIAQRWISRYDQPRVDALADLKKALEETEVETPSFVYNGVVLGFGRCAGPAGLAGYLVLRLACRGFERPSRARLVTAAIKVSEARRSRSARRGGERARVPDGAADHVQGAGETDPQRVLAR
jgi:DNA-binding transcriptional ArsR family regulator